MKHYWNEYMVPRPGIPIKEIELKYDNIYIKDARGRVWQITIQHDSPTILLIDRT